MPSRFLLSMVCSLGLLGFTPLPSPAQESAAILPPKAGKRSKPVDAATLAKRIPQAFPDFEHTPNIEYIEVRNGTHGFGQECSPSLDEIVAKASHFIIQRLTGSAAPVRP